MIEEQISAPLPSGKIPIISPILHCFAMPVIVFWRRNLGYSFLSPKSVFLSSIIGVLMLSYIVWNDPFFREKYLELAIFSLSASILYLVQLVRAISKQSTRTAEHDQDSGISRISVLLSKFAKPQRIIQGVIEPLFTIILGLFLRFNPLGEILIFMGAAFALKELIRYWLTTRREKRMQDSLVDANTMVEKMKPVTKNARASDKGRTDEETHTRKFHKDAAEESHYAEILRLLPPYSIEGAEANFAALFESINPESPNAKETIRRLDEAIGYFRNWLE